MERVKQGVMKALMIILGIQIIVLALITLWQVFARYVLKSPTMGVEELLRFMLIWMAVPGGMYAFASNEHIGFSLFLDKIDKYRGLSLVWKLIIRLVVLAFIVAILLWGGIYQVVNNMDQLSPVLQWKMGRVYLVLPISGLLGAFFLVISIIELAREKRGNPA